MNTLVREQAACRSLNMQFDEASQLFGAETMGSMQMAKVNGGVSLETIATIIMVGAAVISAAWAGIEIYNFYNNRQSPKGTLTIISPHGSITVTDPELIEAIQKVYISNDSIVLNFVPAGNPSAGPTSGPTH